jgi:hypothetical protein
MNVVYRLDSDPDGMEPIARSGIDLAGSAQ